MIDCNHKHRQPASEETNWMEHCTDCGMWIKKERQETQNILVINNTIKSYDPEVSSLQSGVAALKKWAEEQARVNTSRSVRIDELMLENAALSDRLHVAEDLLRRAVELTHRIYPTSVWEKVALEFLNAPKEQTAHMYIQRALNKPFSAPKGGDEPRHDGLVKGYGKCKCGNTTSIWEGDVCEVCQSNGGE